MKCLIIYYVKVLTCKLYCLMIHKPCFPIYVEEIQLIKKCTDLYCDSTLNYCPVCKGGGKKQQHKDKYCQKILKPQLNLMLYSPIPIQRN